MTILITLLIGTETLTISTTPIFGGIQSIFIVHMDLVEDLEVMEEEDMEEDIHSITTTIAITTITLIIEGRNNHINLIDKRFYL